MAVISLSIWWLVGGVLVIFALLIYLIVYKTATGKYGAEKFKAFLPWNKGKGIWIRYHNRSGKEYDRYIKAPMSGRFYEFSPKEKFFLENCYHQLFDDTGTLVPTKDTAYGIPLYHVFEGAPTSVLPLYRNFEQDINYFKDILKKIDEVNSSKNIDVAKAIQKKIYEKMYLLKDEFKYLPDARKISINLLNIPLVEDKENGEKIEIDVFEILKKYKQLIDDLIRVLQKKDKSLVTFTDFFNQGNLSAILSNLVSLTYTTGYLDAMSTIKQNKFINWLLIIIMVIGFVIVGAMIGSQNKKIEALQNGINAVNYDMNIIKPVILEQAGIIEPTNISITDQNIVNRPGV